MPNTKGKTTLYTIVSTIGAFIVLSVIVLCALTEKNTNNCFNHDTILTTISGWTVNGEKLESFPYRHTVSPGETVVLENTLPLNLKENTYMTFRALYCATEVYVDGIRIYEYGKKPLVPFGHITGNIRLLVPLSEDMAGKDVTVLMTAFYTLNNDYYDIEFGYGGDIKTVIFYENLLRISIISMMISIFLAAMGIAVANIMERSVINTKILLNFAFFVFLITVWIICSSDIPQMLGERNSTYALISFMALSMLGIPYAGFCEQLLTKGKKFFGYAKIICWILPIVQMIAFILGFFDPPQTLSLIHLSIFIVAGSSLVFAFLDRNSNRNAKILLAAFIELILAIALGFACFYFAPSKGYDATVFGIGLGIFLWILFGLIIARQVESIEERKYVEIYKELAYSDILTGLGNRAGFDRDFSKLLEYEEKGTEFTLFIFDINYLKETNDNFGHQIGDQIIMNLSKCMREVFDPYGKCYRLGGDEFAVICTDLSSEPEELMKKFDDEIENFNVMHERKLSFAGGFARMKWNGENDFFSNIFKIADLNMYEDKKMKHQKKWEEIYRDNG